MSRSIESRTAERIPIQNPVYVILQGGGRLAALAVNISMGGLSLKASGQIPPGSPCEVAIPLPGTGGEGFFARGTVVRSGAGGMAIQFAGMLGPQDLAVFTWAPALADGSILRAYLTYFRVSQGKVPGECERAYGITRRAFHTLSTVSFLACIPAALLPVWLLRADIPVAPYWVKILVSFGYAAFWLMVMQPAIDLTVIRALTRRRHRKGEEPPD
jgi:hypothetical protein